MKNLLIILMGLIIIGGGAYYWYTSREKAEGPDAMMIEVADEDLENAEGSNADPGNLAMDETASFSATTLQKLMLMGRNLSCNFSNEVDGTKTDGVFNISGTKMAGNYTITAENGTAMNSKMVSDGQFMYTWGDAFPGMGVKIDLSKAEEVAAEATESAFETANQPQMDAFGQEFDYSCAPWSVDSAAFVVPSDIRFLSM